MKKARYTYYCPKGRSSFSSVSYTKDKRYLMRRDSFGLWTSVYLVEGKKGYAQNKKDRVWDSYASSGVWEKAPAKLARRAAQLNKNN
jgi:hypothetical protein